MDIAPVTAPRRRAARPPRSAKLLLCLSAWRHGEGAAEAQRGEVVGGATEGHVAGPVEDEGSPLLPWIWRRHAWTGK
jgi:hypothetical protein